MTMTPNDPRSPYDKQQHAYISGPIDHPESEKDMRDRPMVATDDLLEFLEARQHYAVYRGAIYEYSDIFRPAAKEIRLLKAQIASLDERLKHALAFQPKRNQ